MRRPALALVAITIVAYLPVVRAGFVWDDDSYVEHNATLQSLPGLWRIWSDPAATPQYYPLVHTSFWVEAHVWGVGSAVPFHVTNVLLHAASAVLVWRLVGRLLGGPGAWVAAAVWAVHPVMVESVAWVTERKNVLSGVLYLLALGTYLGGVRRVGRATLRATGPGLLKQPCRWAVGTGGHGTRSPSGCSCSRCCPRR